MTLGEYITMGTVAFGLITNAIVYGWKGGSGHTTIKAAIDSLTKAQEKLDSKTAALERIPVLENRLGYVEKNHSLIPRLEGDIKVLQAQAGHSKEMRAVMQRPQSRPEWNPDE